MAQLERVKDAVWYAFLSGTYTYKEACDIFEHMLPAKSALLKEAK